MEIKEKIDILKMVEDMLYKELKQELSSPFYKKTGDIMNIQKLIKENENSIKRLMNEDYKLMYTQYREGKDNQLYVAVWEQDDVENIRNHKIWKVEESIKSDGVVAENVIGELETNGRSLSFYKDWENIFELARSRNYTNDMTVFETTDNIRCVGKTRYLKKLRDRKNGVYIKGNMVFAIGSDSKITIAQSFSDNDIKFLCVDEGVIKTKEQLEVFDKYCKEKGIGYFVFYKLNRVVLEE